jgi:drug/metabolite transporter (DMT)-like permease
MGYRLGRRQHRLTVQAGVPGAVPRRPELLIEPMSPLATLLLAISLIGTATGQLLFKAASVRAQSAGKGGTFIALARDRRVWIGVAIYLCEVLVWLAFVSLIPLWQAVMVANLDIVVVMVFGRIFFGEHITVPRILAVSLISIGVVLVGWSP